MRKKTSNIYLILKKKLTASLEQAHGYLDTNMNRPCCINEKHI